MDDLDTARGRFRAYVRRVAFSLSLIEQMIAGLRDIYLDGKCTDINTGYNLERRGLCIYNPPPEKDPWQASHRSFYLTKAGELTYGLLIEAGVIDAN